VKCESWESGHLSTKSGKITWSVLTPHPPLFKDILGSFMNRNSLKLWNPVKTSRKYY